MPHQHVWGLCDFWQMSNLLLLPPSIISNSALVNKLSLAEVHISITVILVYSLICIELPISG
jgi:hypothetical protein